MEKATRQVLIGFSACPRFIGAGVVGPASGRALHVRRIGRHGDTRLERLRLMAWVEELVVGHGVCVVVLATSDEERVMLERAAGRYLAN